MNVSKLRLIALVMTIGMLGIGAVVATTTTIITIAEALTVGCPEDLKFVIEASNGNCVREVNTGPPKMD